METTLLLTPGIERVDRLLDLHLAEAVQRFGAGALSVVDLPPLREGDVQPAQIRATATLFWLREVEEAGLPAFVEQLAEQLRDGRLQLPIGARGGDRIGRFWRARNDRFTERERRAQYERVFGDTEGETFDAVFEQHVDALADIGRAAAITSLVPLRARAAVTGGALAQLLSSRGVGITAFAARRMRLAVGEAVEVLRDAEVRAALGVGDLWSQLRRWGPTVLGRPVNPDRHLARANAGVRILEGVADQARAFLSGRTQLTATDPAVRAAATWLSYREQQT